MSATIEVPKGLDKLSPDEQRLMDSMRADEAATAEPEPSREAPEAPEVERVSVSDPTDIEDAPQQPKTVPHQAFHAERERRKAAEERARQVELDKAADMARMEERLKTLAGIAQVATQPAAPAPVAEESVPDVNTDPVGHFQAVAKKLQQQLADQGAIIQGFTQRANQNNQIAELRNWGAAQEQAFEAKEPTYRAAMDHLANSRRAELAAIGVVDPVRQAQIMGQDISNIAAAARQEGANFAERLYALAQQRGFKKPEAPAIPAIDATPADPVERQTTARENATTISSVNGGGPAARLSVQKIADMSEKQFDALVSKLKDDPQALRDLMGH